jgi:hypothetical protein
MKTELSSIIIAAGKTMAKIIPTTAIAIIFLVSTPSSYPY